jgi:hypothetical protein
VLEVGVLTFVALCFAIKALRLYAVVAIAVLAAVHPLVALALAVMASAGFIVYRSIH